ncbi:MAG: GNAT family N-acetyltransferase [Pseudomonadota bacterium]
MNASVRKLNDDELEWANQRYAEVDFVASTAHDYMAVAEIEGEAAGIGRVTPSRELGGMLVFPAFRGAGVAKALIGHLIEHAGGAPLYCVPFIELRALYESAGFVVREPSPSMPVEVLRKYEWCGGHYPKAVLLMARDG